jgi:hypothetical protein
LLIRLFLRFFVFSVEKAARRANSPADSRAQAGITSDGAEERATGRTSRTASDSALLRLRHTGAPRE